VAVFLLRLLAAGFAAATMLDTLATDMVLFVERTDGAGLEARDELEAAAAALLEDAISAATASRND
jgi:hypothetical protein